MGALNSCCCGPKSDGYRTIWTERPWGFYHPFAVDIFDVGPTVAIYQDGPPGEIAGYAHDYFGYPRTWDDPSVYLDVSLQTESRRAWNGTRYHVQRTRTKWLGTLSDGSPVDIEWWDYIVKDVNTGAQLWPPGTEVFPPVQTESNWWHDGRWTNGNPPPLPFPGEPNFGYLRTYEETQSETTSKQVRTFSNDDLASGTIEVETTLLGEVTWADQVNRAKKHLDYIYGTMTAATLKGALPIVHDGGTHLWLYDNVSGPGSGIFGARIYVGPKNGTFSISDDEYTYTEWAPGPTQSLTTNSTCQPILATAARNLPVVFGATRYPDRGTYWTNYVAGAPEFADSGEYAAPVADYGQSIVVHYTCWRVFTPWNCDPSTMNTRFNEIFSATPDARPTWGLTLACTSPLVSLPKGWYAFDSTGVKMTSVPVGTYTYPIPSSDYYTLERAGVCCPP